LDVEALLATNLAHEHGIYTESLGGIAHASDQKIIEYYFAMTTFWNEFNITFAVAYPFGAYMNKI
jgi:hypothetical protein